jgi:cysteine-rich repeat protein
MGGRKVFALFVKNRQHSLMRTIFLLCCLLLSWQTTAQPTSQPLQKITCGDGLLDAGEVCDDGNNLDDDTCAADCLTAPEPIREITPTPLPNTAPKKFTDTDTLVNPVLHEGPYYRSPKVAFWLSAVPTIASFAGLYTTLIYRVVADEKATAALTGSLAAVSVTPSIGMLYAQKPNLAFGLMAARGAGAGLFALGLALHREDPDADDDLDERLIGIGLSTFTILALMEVFSTKNAAKQAHPTGTPKPATILKQ